MSKKTKKEETKKLMKATVAFKYEHTTIGVDDAAHSCTYRFPLKDAQAFEKRAIAMGTTRGQLLMSLVRSFNESTPEPKGVKPVGTASPTIYGRKDREKAGVGLKRARPGEPKKATKVKATKKAPKAAKVTKTKAAPKAAKAAKEAPKKNVTSLGAVLSKLKKAA